MAFYTIIIGIVDLSVSQMLIRQDLRGQKVHFVVLCVCWREFSFVEE